MTTLIFRSPDDRLGNFVSVGFSTGFSAGFGAVGVTGAGFFSSCGGVTGGVTMVFSFVGSTICRAAGSD
jgi:hypothetical protein